MEPMYLEDGDLDFIEKKYPDLFALLKDGANKDKTEVELHSEEEWETIQDLIVDCISGSLDEHDEVNDDGIRLEGIMDIQ
ncbi:hypothetical protein [Paucilactobacillus nenjiangensis]|jgi:molybdopterin converting factor small subunit|uniref:Uncharacterized protein n=1 Tax=Paucilactobacillus nenjiangensis TaxID=1296540 RepID=A0A5P1X2F2_9LACO|nr:hypothetical protein [Paucilactobacillus nenjiangensis]QER67585.1 hypothetical protein F0161_06755 [Paucilactobacillus nenjiangensis]